VRLVTDEAWSFSDAWLMIAAFGFGRRGCDLSQLIASADAYNHDIPTEAIVCGSIGRLRASGLMSVTDLHVRLTDDGRALAKRATGGMFERSPHLLRLLAEWPLSEGAWDELPQGAWQDAYDEYRARSKYM
jgi:hypothetical protein